MMNLIHQSQFDAQISAAIRMRAEMEELSIAEVLAWRMFGIDADFHYMQGELVVLVDLSSSNKPLDK